MVRCWLRRGRLLLLLALKLNLGRRLLGFLGSRFLGYYGSRLLGYYGSYIRVVFLLMLVVALTVVGVIVLWVRVP